MEQAEKMAAAMTDQSQRLAQSWFVIRAAFGTAVLPAFNSFVGWIADMGRDVMAFTQLYPELTKYMGYAAIGILGLVAAGGLFTLTMGAGQMVMTAWSVGMLAATGISGAFSAALTWMRGAILGVNLAMSLNPIGFIVAGIAAAIVAVGALIYYWDDLKAAFLDVSWMNVLKSVFRNVWNFMSDTFPVFGWVIEQLTSLMGIDINAALAATVTPVYKGTPTPLIDAIAPIKTSVARGGITQSLSTANQQKSTTVGTVNVYPAKGDNVNIPAYLEMHA